MLVIVEKSFSIQNAQYCLSNTK